ncbi:MAG: hypothetical protein V2I47_04605 [Bacteroidales bacterium]|jgi:hypothetical protein|nr:hypothetical protein [Bacteroidales bacterium]
MVKIEEILTDSGRATADVAVDVISQKPELFIEAYQLCMAQEGKMAMRAARVVWLVAEHMPEIFEPYFEDMVYKLGGLTHSSVKRCMLKILSVYELSGKEDYHGLIIEACFKYMNDPGEEVAIRGYSIAVLEKMLKIYPEIAGELMAAMQILIDNGPDTLARYSQKKLNELYRSAIA